MTQPPGEGLPDDNQLRAGEAPIDVHDLLTAPTQSAERLLRGKYNRPDLRYFLEQRFTQTPLAPYDIYESTLPYDAVAMDILAERLAAVAIRTELRDVWTDTILREVTEEHSRRMRGNVQAKGRLGEILGNTELAEGEAGLVWHALLGTATMCETGDLLLQHPGMQSIEAAKYTQPLDFNAYKDMADHVNRQLQQYSERGDVVVTVYDQDDKRRDVRPLHSDKDGSKTYVSGSILGFKDNIAEISSGNATVQLVRKQTLIALPISEELKFTIPNVQTLGDAQFNIQPIAYSCYWRSLPVISHQ